MDKMAFYDVAVHHIPVETPWQNGLAERSGGVLKAVLRATIHQTSALGMDVRGALTATLEAINTDTEGVGYSPSQMVLGKNPRVVGAAGANELRSRLPTQTRADEASFARMHAMREVAKLSMLRVHFSRALRRAAVARPRPTIGWEHYSVGDVVYFFREQKAIPKKLKLIQRR